MNRLIALWYLLTHKAFLLVVSTDDIHTSRLNIHESSKAVKILGNNRVHNID